MTDRNHCFNCKRTTGDGGLIVFYCNRCIDAMAKHDREQGKNLRDLRKQYAELVEAAAALSGELQCHDVTIRDYPYWRMLWSHQEKLYALLVDVGAVKPLLPKDGER